MSKHTRRQALTTLAAGILAAGFDPIAHRWISTAHADPACAPLPALDGTLLLGGPALDDDATDVGNIVHRRPWAVLRPGSTADVANMIAYCRCHGVQVAARGQGHQVLGQAQVEGGLIIEASTLATIHSVGPGGIDVDAGVLLRDAIDAALAHGLTLPAFASYLGLSVGGVASIGGVPDTFERGYLVDHVRALEVVDGRGEILACSEAQRPELFDGVLGGLGQLGIVTRATIDLVPAPSRTRSWVLAYTDVHAFFRDMRMLLDRGEVSGAYGQIAPPGPTLLPAPPADVVQAMGPLAAAFGLTTKTLSPLLGAATMLLGLPPGVFVYELTVFQHYDGAAPDDPYLLRGAADLPGLRTTYDQTYREFIGRVDVLVDFLVDIGMWEGVPHPWLDAFLPENVAEGFVADAVSEMDYEDVGSTGLVLLFPEVLAARRRSFPVMPGADPRAVLFGVLTAAPGPGAHADFVADKLARNRRWFEAARAVGGTLYPHCAVHLSPGEWQQQLGASYAGFAALKQHHDPDGILTPGPGVFAAT